MTRPEHATMYGSPLLRVDIRVQQQDSAGSLKLQRQSHARQYYSSHRLAIASTTSPTYTRRLCARLEAPIFSMQDTEHCIQVISHETMTYEYVSLPFATSSDTASSVTDCRTVWPCSSPGSWRALCSCHPLLLQLFWQTSGPIMRPLERESCRPMEKDL